MGVAKAALESVSRYLARDLGPQRRPREPRLRRPVETPAAAGHPGLRDARGRCGRRRRRSAGTPRTRAPVADAVLFLLSDLARGDHRRDPPRRRRLPRDGRAARAPSRLRRQLRPEVGQHRRRGGLGVVHEGPVPAVGQFDHVLPRRTRAGARPLGPSRRVLGAPHHDRRACGSAGLARPPRPAASRSGSRGKGRARCGACPRRNVVHLVDELHRHSAASCARGTRAACRCAGSGQASARLARACARPWPARATSGHQAGVEERDARRRRDDGAPTSPNGPPKSCSTRWARVTPRLLQRALQVIRERRAHVVVEVGGLVGRRTPACRTRRSAELAAVHERRRVLAPAGVAVHEHDRLLASAGPASISDVPIPPTTIRRARGTSAGHRRGGLRGGSIGRAGPGGAHAGSHHARARVRGESSWRGVIQRSP